MRWNRRSEDPKGSRWQLDVWALRWNQPVAPSFSLADGKMASYMLLSRALHPDVGALRALLGCASSVTASGGIACPSPPASASASSSLSPTSVAPASSAALRSDGSCSTSDHAAWSASLDRGLHKLPMHRSFSVQASQQHLLRSLSSSSSSSASGRSIPAFPLSPAIQPQDDRTLKEVGISPAAIKALGEALRADSRRAAATQRGSQAEVHAATAEDPSGEAVVNVQDLAGSLSELEMLEMLFPGFSLDRMLQADAEALLPHLMHARAGRQPRESRVVRAMRVFHDLAPHHLPPVGLMMPRIGRWILRAPERAAGRLRLLDAACMQYLGQRFPAEGLHPRCFFLDLSDAQLSETVFALAAVLGPERAAQALASDVTLLGLAPRQIEKAVQTLAQRLQVPSGDLSLVQALAATMPAVLHMNTDALITR